MPILIEAGRVREPVMPLANPIELLSDDLVTVLFALHPDGSITTPGGLTVDTLDVTGLETIASAAGATYDAFKVGPGPVTLTGNTAITTVTGFNLVTFEVPVITAAQAVNIDYAATVAIAGPPDVQGMASININEYALWVQGGIVRIDGFALDASNGSGLDLELPLTTNGALTVTGAVTYLQINTTVAPAQTIRIGGGYGSTQASGAFISYSGTQVDGATLTLTGNTLVTAVNGLGLQVTAGTITDTMAETVTTASSLYVSGPPTAGGMVTITNAWAIHAAGAIRVDGNISVANQATSILVNVTTNNALQVSDGTTAFIAIDSRNNQSAQGGVTLAMSNPTIASQATVTVHAVTVTGPTVTLSGNTHVTTFMDGVGVSLSAPSLTAGMALTVDNAATLTIAPPAAAGMVTLTNAYALHTTGGVRIDGNINVAAQATTITVIANTAAAWRVFDGTTAIISVDTRNTVTAAGGVTLAAAPPTIASGATVTFHAVTVTGPLVTLSGNTHVTTTMDGVALSISAPSITAAMALTVDKAATLTVAAPTAAGMVTLTAPLAINAAGQVIVNSATAVPANGAATAGLLFSTTAAFGVFFGSNAPTFTAQQGSLYLRTDGAMGTRAYINSSAGSGNTWTGVTTAA